ncbi:hypothetical protein, partial [Pseudomonas sp. GW460-13]|uniref:hypothetical protein n=1 Tax=Pseudomonas sp. GW460-13 TaxID=2070590 RepID=UPI0011AF57FC
MIAEVARVVGRERMKAVLRADVKGRIACSRKVGVGCGALPQRLSYLQRGAALKVLLTIFQTPSISS